MKMEKNVTKSGKFIKIATSESRCRRDDLECTLNMPLLLLAHSDAFDRFRLPCVEMKLAGEKRDYPVAKRIR